MLKVRPPFYVVPTLLFLGVAFALANGLGYGSGNLRQYLLHGLHALDADFLANDWFTTQTISHHSMFDRLIVLFAKATSLEVAFACANAALAMILIVCVHVFARRYYRAPLLVTAMTALLMILVPRPYIGWTTIINGYFQPSTIGAVGLLVGLAYLCFERYKSAGAVLLIAGIFHINYVVWSALLVGIVVAVNLHRIGVRRALYVVVPIGVAVLYHLPFFAVSRSAEQVASSAFAATILHDIYMPFHSRPMTWGVAPFIRFAVMLLAGGVSVWAIGPLTRPNRITVTVLAAIAGAVLLGMIFTTVIPIDTVALIFPYRLAPFLILASQVAVAGAIATSAQFSVFSPSRTLLLWLVLGGLLYGCGLGAYGLSCLGALATALLAGRLVSEPVQHWKTSVLVMAGLVAAVYFGGAGRTGIVFVAAFAVAGLAWRVMRGQATAFSLRDSSSTGTPNDRTRPVRWSAALPAGKLVVPLCIAAFLMRQGAVRKDLVGPPPPVDEQVLYEWCRARTDPGDVFIIPPGLAGFRLGAGRAVAADWKCMPILPKDTVRWYERLTTICGRDFRSPSQAEEGFDQMDEPRARRLAAQFGARYLIARRDSPIAAGPCHRAFVNRAFAVLDLRQD